MKWLLLIISQCFLCLSVWANQRPVTIQFYGTNLVSALPEQLPQPNTTAMDANGVQQVLDEFKKADFTELVSAIKNFRVENPVDDWFFYQLVRTTANNVYPKLNNYRLYTLFKYFLLRKNGYDAQLAITGGCLYLFIQCNDEIYDLPCIKYNGKQYTCLNRHDYENETVEVKQFLPIQQNDVHKSFSFVITNIPALFEKQRAIKSYQFYNGFQQEQLDIAINPQLNNIFRNYPSLSAGGNFTVPVSSIVYESLIPALHARIQKMPMQDGVNYLMNFVRYAFPYMPDSLAYGREKKLTPEQVLLNKSDCDDRVALMYWLVQQLYNVPMVVIAYPDHIVLGLQLNVPVGQQFAVGDNTYTLCDPTPAGNEFVPLGQLPTYLKGLEGAVLFEYKPASALSIHTNSMEEKLFQ